MKQEWEAGHVGNFVIGRLYLINGSAIVPLNNDGSDDCCGAPRSHQLQSLPHKKCNVWRGGLFSFHFMRVGVLSHLAIGFSAPVLQFTVSMAFGRTAVALNSCAISSTSFCLSFSIFFF